jgi:hypothetical protein
VSYGNLIGGKSEAQATSNLDKRKTKMPVTLGSLFTLLGKGASAVGHASGMIELFQNVFKFGKDPAAAVGMPKAPRGSEEELGYTNLYMKLTKRMKYGADKWIGLVYTPKGDDSLDYEEAKQEFFKFVLHTGDPKKYLEEIAKAINHAETPEEEQAVIARYRGHGVPMPRPTFPKNTIRKIYAHVGPKDGAGIRFLDKIL